MQKYIKQTQTEQWMEFLEEYSNGSSYEFSRFVDFEVILKNPHKHNPGYVFLNPNVTWEIIKNNYYDKPYLQYYWPCISCNPNITWEIIQSNPDEPWAWSQISRNPNITWEIIQSNPNKKWDWYYVSRNPNITWEIIQSNSDKPWD